MVEAISLGFAQLNLPCLLQRYQPFSLKVRKSQLSVKRDIYSPGPVIAIL